jgi:hypothetical protein
MKKHDLAWDCVKKIVDRMFAERFHHLQVLSLALVAFGVTAADRLGVAAVGRAMARARGTRSKHGVKQVDRFLSNGKLPMAQVFRCLVPVAVGPRKHIVVTMDWTDFDADDQTTICLSLVTRSKRAQPLVWMTVRKSTLRGNRSAYERKALQLLRDSLPVTVGATILADRGFGDTHLYDHLLGIRGFHFVVRFRACILIRSDSLTGRAVHLVPSNGRVRLIHSALLTADRKGPYTVVLYKASGMKDSWCLATSLPTQDGHDIVRSYAHRFECEEGFRDAKDRRFGMGLKAARIRRPDRRDRMLLAFALAYLLFTIAGQASEQLALDRTIRANTVHHRTHSLFRQGRETLGAQLPAALANAYHRLVSTLVSRFLARGMGHALA